ncbi:MAG: Hsp20/alpha crystallin family protein [Candidatus Pacearchaeota archaeon]
MRRFKPFMRRISDWANEFPDEDFSSPDVDIVDKEEELMIKIDLPGVKKEDIKLNINSDSIEIKCEKTEERKDEEEGDYYLSERYYRGFYRKISLPRSIIPEDAKARFRNGVLEITAPKFEDESSNVEIED